MKRAWETLPEDRRTARALHLLSTPIVGLDNFKTDSRNYPDPGNLLQNDLPPPTRTGDNESRWQGIVSLLVRGLRAGGEARKRASLRIEPVVFWHRLTEAESSQVAQALWSEKHTRSNDLPGETLLFDWAFLLFPEPELGLAEHRFRCKWLTASSAPQEDEPSLDDILWQIGMPTSPSYDGPALILPWQWRNVASATIRLLLAGWRVLRKIRSPRCGTRKVPISLSRVGKGRVLATSHPPRLGSYPHHPSPHPVASP